MTSWQRQDGDPGARSDCARRQLAGMTGAVFDKELRDSQEPGVHE